MYTLITGNPFANIAGDSQKYHDSGDESIVKVVFEDVKSSTKILIFLNLKKRDLPGHHAGIEQIEPINEDKGSGFKSGRPSKKWVKMNIINE